MKKLMTIALMAVAALTANAQDIQLHYDFGRNIYPDEEDGRRRLPLPLSSSRPITGVHGSISSISI